MIVLANLISLGITIYTWIIIAHVLIHWLIAFDVINASSPQAQNLLELLKKVTDPVMKPVQKYVPPIGGIDLSPLVVIILLQLLNQLVWSILVV